MRVAKKPSRSLSICVGALVFVVGTAPLSQGLPQAWGASGSITPFSSSGTTSASGTSTPSGGSLPNDAASSSTMASTSECTSLQKNANGVLQNNTQSVTSVMNGLPAAFGEIVSALSKCITGLASLSFPFTFNFPICTYIASAIGSLTGSIASSINLPYGMGSVGVNASGMLAGLNGAPPLSMSGDAGTTIGVGAASSSPNPFNPTYQSYATGNVTGPAGININGNSTSIGSMLQGGTWNSSGGAGAAGSSTSGASSGTYGGVQQGFLK